MNQILNLAKHTAILEILLQKEHLAADVDLGRLATLTDGFSGSDLKRELLSHSWSYFDIQTCVSQLPWLR